MSLYRVAADKLEPVPTTTFAEEKLLERKDLQRLLHSDITPLGDDLLVITEEYSDWEDCNRRVDLLCLNKAGDLVVVEIKRTDDGGHMELQALRYAAMVSGTSFDQIVSAHARFLQITSDSARDQIAAFLNPSVGTALTGKVRIVLVASNFSTEITTAVIWLNRQGLDITCVRLKPYRAGNDVLVDVTQIIPLPEAADYLIKQRKQEQEKQQAISDREEMFRRFWGQLVTLSRDRTPLLAGRTTSADQWISTGIGRAGFSLTLSLTADRAQVECFIRIGSDETKSLAAFAALQSRQPDIEVAYGAPLIWEDLPGRLSCRICDRLSGGWATPEPQWRALQDKLIDAMIRLEKALRGPIQDLKI